MMRDLLLIKARWEEAKDDLAKAQYIEALVHQEYLNVAGDFNDEEPSINPAQSIKAQWEKAENNLAEAYYIEELIHQDYLNAIRNLKTDLN